MKHSTNYFNTLIEIAEDCPASQAEVPPLKGDKKSVANLQFEMLIENPYRYTSDEVFFAVHAQRKEIAKNDFEAEKALFFSKGQPCFRASPLTKRYGWGVHSNVEGKVALHGMDAETYTNLVEDETVSKKKAMRSKRK
ncbi:MAG: DUF6157 family protein [Saprospiraceae bacterium]